MQKQHSLSIKMDQHLFNCKSNHQIHVIVYGTPGQCGVVVWLTMYNQGRSPGKAMFGFLCFILILISFHLNSLLLHFFIPIF